MWFSYGAFTPPFIAINQFVFFFQTRPTIEFIVNTGDLMLGALDKRINSRGKLRCTVGRVKGEEFTIDNNSSIPGNYHLHFVNYLLIYLLNSWILFLSLGLSTPQTQVASTSSLASISSPSKPAKAASKSKKSNK